MAGDLGSLVVSLTAETAQFKDALTKSAYQMEKSMGDMSAHAKGLEKSLGQVDAQLASFGINLKSLFGMAAAGGFAALISSSIESAGKMHDLSEKTGIAAGEFAAMRSAAAEGGISIEQIGQASAKFSKAIETQDATTGKAAQALAALGISMDEIKNKTPAEQLHLVAQRMNTFADGSGKAAAAQVLFKGVGEGMIPFLKAYGDQVETNIEGYNEFAANADALGDSIARLKVRSQSVADQFTAALMPALIGISTGFEAMNAGQKSSVGFADLLGEGIRVLALGFVSLWTVVKDVTTATVGYSKVMANVLTLDFKGAAAALDETKKGFSDNHDALLAFSDKALAGSKIFRDTTEATAQMGTAAAAAKPKIDLQAQAVDKAAEAGKKWVEALQGNIDKLNLTELEMLKLEARHKGLGASADKLIVTFIELKKKTEDKKKEDEAAATATKKLTDQIIDFHKKLQDQTAELGLSEGAMLKYKARQLELNDSQDEAIDKYIAAKEALEKYKIGVTQAIDAWAAYLKGVQAVRDQAAGVITTWEDGNKALRFQNETMGLSKSAIDAMTAAKQYESDRLKILLIEDATERATYLELLKKEYDERLSLINSAEVKAAYQESAKAAAKAYEDSAKAINNYLVEGVAGGFKSAKSIAEDFKTTLVGMFKNLVLRPILQPVANYLAGVFQQGQTALGGMFGAGGLFSGTAVAGASDYAPGENPASFVGSAAGAAMGGWGGILGAAALGAAASSQFGSKNPTYGAIAGAGAMIGLAGTAGVVATGAGALAAGAATMAGATAATSAAAGAMVVAAVPVIGWIVAAIALIAAFAVKPGGGPKSGGSQLGAFDSSGAGSYSRGGYYTPNQADADMKTAVAGMGASYFGYIAALGGKAAAVAFGLGYDTDPLGTAQNRLTTSVGVGGRNVYGFANLELGRDPALLQARMTVEAQRMILAAIQASELPDDIAHLIDGLSPGTLGATEIQNVLNYAAAFHSLPQTIKDALEGITGLDIAAGTSIALTKFGAAYSAIETLIAGDPGADAQAALAAAGQTSIEKFRAQTSALVEMATAFDGSAEAALNLAQATAKYYENQVALLVALEQASVEFHKSIEDVKRGMFLESLEASQRVIFYRDEIEKNSAVLSAAAAAGSTSDPADIVRLGEQSKTDLLAWWNSLDADSKRAGYGEFAAKFDLLDTQVSAANKAIADAIKAQNDPANPASPIGQVKGAFDKFILDMNAWLEANKGATSETIAASQQMVNAADTMQAAGETMLAAANTPNHIDLTVNGSEVTAGSGGGGGGSGGE